MWLLRCAIFVPIRRMPCSYCVASFCGRTGTPKSPAGHAVLIAGIAGLLAGAFSMSIGEWVSVQSARELNQHQVAIARQELQDAPREEQEELALIYQSKGLEEKTANELAANLMQQSNTALD